MLTQKLAILESLIESNKEIQEREFRYITNGVNWQQYETLLNNLDNQFHFRLTYLNKVLEIMSPSRNHEVIKSRIGTLLELYFLETNTEYYPTGSTTFRKKEKKGGTEPDESYCIGRDKEFPDLAIEVVFTSGGIDRLAVYQRLAIPEIWFWQDEQFFIYHLRPDDLTKFKQNYGYELINQSEILPDLNINILAKYVKHPHPLTAAKEFLETLRSKEA